MSGRDEQELFRRALAELQQLDRDAMWKAKVGNAAHEPLRLIPGGADKNDAATCGEADSAAAEGPLQGELLAEFEALLADAPAAGGMSDGLLRDDDEDDEERGDRADGNGGTRCRAVRVGESPIDRSPLPSLARPRPAELRDLESGRRPVDRRLDLHGRTVQEAQLLLRDELAHAREAGLHYLLVITGRGVRSEAGARLRPAVQQFLAHDGREHVLWFDAAPPRLGGTGAFLVRVRRPGKSKGA